MKKFLLTFLTALLMGSALQGQNPTGVYTTNGFTNFPPTIHYGKVTVGPSSNGISSTGATNFFGHSTNGGYKFYPPPSGGGTPGGATGNVQYNNAGAFGGSNSFNLLFSGADARLTNAAGGQIEFYAPTTNLNFFSRHAVFGPVGTTIPEQYQDFYIKFQHPTFPGIRIDSTTTSKGSLVTYFDEAGSGGFQFDLGRFSTGGPTLEITMGTAATSPILMKNLGASDFQFAVPYAGGAIMSWGFMSSGTYVPHGYATNDAFVFNRQVIIPQQAITYSGSNVTWNVTNKANAFITLTNNAVLLPTGFYPGGTYQLSVMQDGTGGRTLSYSNIIKWASGLTPTITTNAGALDVLNFTAISTNASSTNLVGAYIQDAR